MDPEQDELDLLDLALLFAENLRLLVLVPLVCGLIALGISFSISPTYTAVVRVLPPQHQQSTSAMLAAQLGALAGLVGAGGGLKNPGDLYVGLLKSRTVLDAMIQRFNLKEYYKATLTEDARRTLEGATKATLGIKDGIITIEVDDHDPKRAAEIGKCLC
jgi:capsular polysaccharide biosynthesis protein